MSNIVFYSHNTDFADDLAGQIERYAPEFQLRCGNDSSVDIAIIDNDMAEYNRLRREHKNIPLIFLFDDKHDIDENSLNIALKKPFSLSHFFDILHSARNKLDNSKDGYLNFGIYQLRPVEKELENLHSREITKLTEREVDIIKYLHKFPDVFVSKSELQRNVWKYNDEVSTHTVETHIYRLRCKVEKNDAPQLIYTDKGGYKLNTES